MGSSKKRQPTPPPAPDPYRIIEAQTQANRVDQFTPLGSLTFSGPMRNQANLNLNPQLQANLNQQMGLDAGMLSLANQALGFPQTSGGGMKGAGSAVGGTGDSPGIASMKGARGQGGGQSASGEPTGIAGLIANPLSAEGLPGLPTDMDAFRAETERAFFDRSSSLLDEQFGLDEERLRQRLANQGLQSGGQGFGTEMGLFNQRRGETFENLARDARLFGQDQASQRLQDATGLRQFLFNERGGIRGNQFNELASLLGLQQVQQPGLGSFIPPGQANVTDAFGLQQQALRNNFNTQSQIAGANKGAFADLVGNLGGAGILKYSDRRLKTNIKKLTKVNGIQWYTWDWKYQKGGSMGVMADEVPHAAHLIDGIWNVDYGAL